MSDSKTAKIKVVLLGSTGMLGSMVRRVLSSQPHSAAYDLLSPSRIFLDALSPSPTLLRQLLSGRQYAVNCIGVIKPRIDERDRTSIERAIRVNSLFPHLLSRAAEEVGCRVIQIATDCVYSGREGGYSESAPHDPLDVYGRTKSLGEVSSPAVRHLRCSIIGPEPAGRPRDSLLEWFLSHPRGATVRGYTNHHWNGVTTLAFARLCHGIMSGGVEFSTLPPVQHVVPFQGITKADLLSHLAYFYNRQEDILLEYTKAPVAVDRTLTTTNKDTNWALWRAAGYSGPPTIQQMVEELSVYSRAAEEVPAQ